MQRILITGASSGFRHGRRQLKIIDEKGGTATVTTPDMIQSNGGIDVVDTVLLPNWRATTSAAQFRAAITTLVGFPGTRDAYHARSAV